ncbi:Histidinol-phosphate aminotransferase [BD1-7 clade bacterium]|uniref:Histidinol-phosphate aminotransferase n=1 Tax=BD1-7 clade bacterium TaxID=2029982 RepID=A0A5S9QZC3_9GAMM|nr:Histidinol-phosphate aminotransferase [BD1-7 clade bacterium]
MSRFWSPLVSQLEPYVPGEQPKVSNLIKLNTNENPYPPSPAALEAMQAEMGASLRLYPDPESSEIKAAVAEYYKLSPEQVFVGNGSDEVLAHAFQALINPAKPLLYPDITYSFYPVYCQLYGITPKTMPLDAEFAINPADYQTDNGGIIFPNPNAPTGLLLPLDCIKQILDANPDTVVMVDEAYIDFGGESAVSLINDYDNLLVIQTLSKSRSLAGLRVGFAMGNADLIDGLERVKNSFNSYPIDRLAIKGSVAAIKDTAWFEMTRGKIIASREKLTHELQALGFSVIPSAANFVFAHHPEHNAQQLGEKLRDNKIIVRYFNKPRISEYIRITVGTEEECEALMSNLKSLITTS